MADNSSDVLPGREARAHLDHFATAEQQRNTAMAGMWIFLVTEIMMFGGLFMAYAVYRLGHPQAFASASRDMNIVLGAVNTAILITSSFTMALAAQAAEEGLLRPAKWLLAATILIGIVFLGIKFVEYYQHYRDHKAPGFGFQTNLPDPGGIQMFYIFYFAMTGLHAVHMIVGIGLLAALLIMTELGRFSREYHSPVVITGLYWGFVDIVWVFLFAIFYLPGLHLHG
ncbi:MAG TPA: cytochrome c oxidase subunit 3 [Bryobacteraceae bacterium]|nr:cytochrome c oxidase subunit 3 [Bryobacteraceae bacterium]